MGYVLIAPAVLSILLLSIYPLINGVGISLLNYNITRSKDPSFGTFAGIKNYITIFTDHNFQQAAGNTVLWVLTNVIFQVLFALLIALTLNQKLKGRSFFRTMSLIPWAIPSVVSALTFSFLYDSKVGIFNILLQKSGIISKPISWLGNIETAMPSVIVSTIWKGTPFLMIFILAALQGIPEEVYESSGIDGAGKLRTFFSITLPMIKEPVSVAVILNVISIFNNFNATEYFFLKYF
jgi:multiple sugar transport system permease protein